MGRPRQYGSDAERQRAFRQRQEAQIARVDRGALDRLHARLDQLQLLKNVSPPIEIQTYFGRAARGL